MDLSSRLVALVLVQILVQTRSIPVNRNLTENLKENSAENLKENPAENLKENSAENLKENPAENLKENLTEDKPAPRSADVALHYNSYLQQVVQHLEKDPHFREKLRNANSSYVQEGSLSQHLDFVHHNIRAKLDELKREEITRLRVLLKAKKDLLNGHGVFRNNEALLKHFQHLDFRNPHGFEAEDLDRLIKAATKDLQSVNLQKHEAFKRYEMLKEHERRERLKDLTSEEREREERHLQELKEKQRQHAKINRPGSEEQLKQVWHQTDGLDVDDFNPKTFFKLHDVNQDGFLDDDEQEALFSNELEKAFDLQNPQDDMLEMEEERLRMRQELMSEYDSDGDQIISEQEFMDQTKRDQFHKNQEWETLGPDQIFTEAEMSLFEKNLKNRLDKHSSEAEELEKQKQDLELKQRELDQRRQELNQAWDHLDQLKEKKNQDDKEELKRPGSEPGLNQD